MAALSRRRANNTIRIVRPRLEESLYCVLFGRDYLNRVFEAFHASQSYERPPNFMYHENTELSREYLAEELRLSIIYIAARVDFQKASETDPCMYYFFDTKNGSGKSHGFCKVPSDTRTLIRVNGQKDCHYRIIMGSLDLESLCGKSTIMETNGETELTPGAEFRLPPYATYQFINKECINCLMYFTE